MPHIALPEGVSGIRGPMMFRPETAKPMNALADALLRGTHPLPDGDRELISASVSSRNDCVYCQTMHGAGKVQQSGRNVTPADIARARQRAAQIATEGNMAATAAVSFPAAGAASLRSLNEPTCRCSVISVSGSVLTGARAGSDGRH